MKTLRIEPLFGLKLIPDAKAIPFMRARLAGIAMSILFSLASIALFFKPGLNYGVDFHGGIQMEVVTKGPADLSSLRSGLDSLGLGEVTLQEFGNPSTVLVRAERQPGGEDAQNAAVQSIRAKLSEIAAESRIERTEVVGPKSAANLPRRTYGQSHSRASRCSSAFGSASNGRSRSGPSPLLSSWIENQRLGGRPDCRDQRPAHVRQEPPAP